MHQVFNAGDIRYEGGLFTGINDLAASEVVWGLFKAPTTSKEGHRSKSSKKSSFGDILLRF